MSGTVTPQLPPWLQEIYNAIGGGTGYVLTPDDLQAIAYYGMMQQYQVGQGQNDVNLAQVGYQQNKLDYDNEYLGYLGEQMGFDREKMAFEYEQFQREQALYPQQFQLEQQKLDNALQLGGYELDRAKEYQAAQMYQTQQAQYGAEAAKYQWLAETGQIAPRVTAQQKVQNYGYHGG